MAQEIVHWCDWHFDRGEREVGRTRVVALDAGALELELCDDCWARLTTELGKVAAEHGRPVSADQLAQRARQQQAGPGKQRPRVECPVEGCTVRLYRASFRNHLESEHGTTLAVMEAQLGHTLEGEPIVHHCDVPGCGAGFANATGMAAHKHTMHGIGADQDQLPTAPAEEPEPAKRAPAKRATKRASSKTKAGGSK